MSDVESSFIDLREPQPNIKPASIYDRTPTPPPPEPAVLDWGPNDHELLPIMVARQAIDSAKSTPQP